MSKKDRTARLVRIEHLLYQHPAGLSVERLADMCGVHKRTIYRDLRALEDPEIGVGAPIWCDDGRYGIGKGFYLPPLRLTLFEGTTLFLSSRLAYRYSDERNRHLESAWEKMAAVMPGPAGRHVQSTVVAMSRKPANDDFSHTTETIVTAWSEGKRVRILYPSRGKERWREIEPYFLEPSGMGHSLYVIAYDVGVRGMRTFKAERIRNVELTNESFEMPDSFDADRYLGSSWSIWQETTVEVKVRFSARVASRVYEANWHPSQSIQSQPDGSLVWTAMVSGTVEIVPWIRSWGADAEVLQPKELRDRFVLESKRLADLYG